MYGDMYANKSKIIFLGDSNVGKTSIIHTYLKKNGNVTSTIGTEFFKKYMPKYNRSLQVWDCAGQECYRAICKLYYRGSDACILVFDLSEPTSLESIKNYWISIYMENCSKPYRFILVGNKSDKSINIDYNIIWNLCKSYNMRYVETSVITQTNIDIIFNLTCELLNDSNTLNNNTLNNNTLNNNTLNNNTSLVINTDYRYNYFSNYC